MTDQELLSDIQQLLAETVNGGTSWSSGMWTADEVLGELNDTQNTLISETGLTVTRASLVTPPYLLTMVLPQAWIATLRVVWIRASDSQRFVLDRSDILELDAGLPGWRTAPGTPQYYTDADAATLVMRIAPAPAAAGHCELTYLALPTQLTGAGTAVEVPAEAGLGLVWGTISGMLRKEGRAKDLARADAAQQRADLVTEAVKLLLRAGSQG